MRPIDGDALVDAMTGACNIFDAHGVDTTIARTLITVATKAPTIGGWISVKDRLPKKQGVYLVAFKPPLPKVTIAWWATKEVGWYDLEYNFHTDSVSHWMPLPPMPEQEVSGDE